MKAPDDASGIPLPVFERPDAARHPVLAAVLAELRERETADEPPVAYYGDSPDPNLSPPRPSAGAVP